MRDAVDRYYEAEEEAQAAVGRMLTILRDEGVDMAESNDARKLRRISEDLGEVRQSVEDYGLRGEEG